jgi:hypothetical protein
VESNEEPAIVKKLKVSEEKQVNSNEGKVEKTSGSVISLVGYSDSEEDDD